MRIVTNKINSKYAEERNKNKFRTSTEYTLYSNFLRKELLNMTVFFK